MNVILLIVAIVWLVGMFLSYKFVISKWDNSTFEKVWFTIVWPVLLPLYVVHYVHNNL